MSVASTASPASRPVERGDAEVGHQGVAVGEQDVLRLDVAVDDPLAVRVPQRLRHLAHQAHGVHGGERAVAAEAVAQTLALHVGHREPEHAVGVARVVHREYVGVLQAGGEADLATESLRSHRVRELRVEHLEGDGPVVSEIAGQVDRSHPAAAELAAECVAFPQGLGERGQNVGDGDGSMGEDASNLRRSPVSRQHAGDALPL